MSKRTLKIAALIVALPLALPVAAAAFTVWLLMMGCALWFRITRTIFERSKA